MAYLAPSGIFPNSAGINSFLDSHEQRLYPFDCTTATLSAVTTAKAEHLPLTQPCDAKAAYYGHGFGLLDWYNRIHVTPTAINCGNIITPQVQNITVWNAWINAAHTLSAITPTDAEGLTVTDPAVLPSPYKALQVRTITVAISNIGPPNIAASFLLDFDTVDVTVTFTGSRIVAWTARPEWGRGILERLEWKTDVMTAFDGSEQRMALRKLPRRSFEFEFWIDNAAARRKLEALLWNWGALVWALPIWTDVTYLASQLPAGSTSIPITTTYRDYVSGGLLVLMTDELTFEVCEIDTVNPSSITLVRQTQSTWNAGAMVMPARTAYLQQQQPISRFTGDVPHEIARFTLTDDSDHAALSESTYRGFPVIEQASDWSKDVSMDYARKSADIDFGQGMRFDDEAGIPTLVQAHHWVLDGRAAIDAFRSLLYARRGRYKGAWIPSFLQDLNPVANLVGGGATIDIEHCNYTLHYAMAKNRRDIRIELVGGTVYYRRITSAQELSSTVERITLDTPHGSSVSLTNIYRISFMMFGRFDADAIELHWDRADVVEASANWRSVNNDV